MAVDFSELEKFKDQIKNLEQEISAFEEDCAKELGARLLRAVREKTPVGIYPEETGKMGGTLKRSWYVADAKRTSEGYSMDVINNTEYASYVEYGHRQNVGQYVPALGKRLKKPWVEGRHMLKDSVDELQGKADAIIEKKMQKWLEEKLNGK